MADAPPLEEFSWANARIIERINVCLSFVSLVACVLVLCAYRGLREIRSFAFRLVAWMALSDALLAAVNLLGDPANPDTWIGGSPVLCSVQA